MTVVNYETGEIAESGSALVPVRPTSESGVLALLESCATWLSTAVECSTPDEVANMRAQASTIAEATKKLHLSKEIQLDAVEMVRCSEYALAKKIRQGQVEGSIRTRADGGYPSHKSVLAGDTSKYDPKPSATEYATSDELYGNGAGIMALADVEPEDFDAALGEAKAEGSLSRANVVRKVKGQKTAHVTREARADMIRDLAEQGYSSRQMPAKVGVSEEHVRIIARDLDIDIPADKAILRTKRLDHTQMVESTVTDLENTAEFVGSFIDLNEVDLTNADEWADAIDESCRKLRAFTKALRSKKTGRAATRPASTTTTEEQ